MSISLEVSKLATLPEKELFAKLGELVRSEELGMLPNEHESSDNHTVGYNFFNSRAELFKQLICNKTVSDLMKDEKKRDVVNFVSITIDGVSAYLGVPVATIVLVQIYKIGVDNFCTTVN